MLDQVLALVFEVVGEHKLQFGVEVGSVRSIKLLLSDAAQYKAEKDAFAERERAAKAKAESLKAYLQNALQGDAYKSTRVNISYRKSSSVVVDDVLNLPPRFVKFKDPEPDKIAIKEAIKNGEEVNGARIENNVSIIIK